ncbi:MAG TPA: O-antigen ligase family protein [Syntrophorhabdus sp.]|nr:O-antigen ligase family protein [Syntrophorhabdus sp.]
MSYTEDQPISLDSVFAENFPRWQDVNPGIILISIYFLFELGSIQGLYQGINELKIPAIVSYLTMFYALYLIASNQVDWLSMTTRRFALLCAFIILYTLFSTKLEVARIDLVKIFLLIFSNYIVFICSVKRPSQFILLVDIWLFSIMFSSFHGIMQGGKIWGNRWLKDENHISLIAAMAIPFAFMLYRLYKPFLRKIFYAACLFFYVSVNVVAASRGGALAMIVVAFFCWLFTSHKLRNTLIILSATVLVLSFAPPVFFEEMATLKQGTQEGTASDRIYLWGIAMDMFEDHPFWGVGPMNYPYYFSSYEKGAIYPIGALRVAHSTPVQYLAEFGALGSFIFLFFLYALYRNWRNTYTYTRDLSESRRVSYSEVHSYELISHACGISQVGFWFGALFLTLLPYPFYWCLVPMSESWRVLFHKHVQYINGHTKS